MLPEITIPDISSYEQISARAHERGAQGKVRAALVTPNEPDMLRAFAQASKEGLIEPIIVGECKSFQECLMANEIDIQSMQVLDVADPISAVARAADLVAGGEVDLLVKGRMLTGDFLKLLFLPDAHFTHKDKIISHVAVLRPAKYEKLIMLTDSAVNICPDLKTKLALIDNIVTVGKAVGIMTPRVALLAAVEVIYPQMQVTMEAAIIAKMWERGQIKGAMVDGPLSLDVAVDMFAAHSKGVKSSPVAGQADALVAPNLETANGVYKAMALYGHCEMGGVIVGGKVPIALGSRSDTWQGKYNSLLLGILSVPKV